LKFLLFKTVNQPAKPIVQPTLDYNATLPPTNKNKRKISVNNYKERSEV